MLKHFLIGAVLGLLTLVLLAVMFNFVEGLSGGVDGGSFFSTSNSFGVVLAYGLAMAIIGSLADRMFSKKKKRK